MAKQKTKQANGRVNTRSLIASFRRLSPYLLQHRRSFLLIAACMIAAAAVEILRPWPIKIVFDVILVPQNDPGYLAERMRDLFGAGNVLLALCALGIFTIAVLAGLISFAETSMLASVGQKVIAAVRYDLYRHIQRLSQSYHDTTSTGDLLARLTGDVRLLRDLLVNSVMFIGARLLIFVGMVAVMFSLDWQLTLVALSAIPALMLVARHFVGRIKSAAREQRRNESRIAHVVTENLSAIRLIQAFAREPLEDQRFKEQSQSSAEAEIAAARQAAFLDRMVKIFVAAGTCGVVWFGVMRVQAGVLTPGDLLVFTTYLAALYKPIKKIAELTGRLAKASVRAERIIEILDRKPDVQDRPGASRAQTFKGEIRLDGVSFDYGREADVLKNASMTIKAGEMIALISESGAGKSTVAHLLLRFYDPKCGSIEIDGNDIRNYRLASLREQITVLLQDTPLFNTTIRQNIGYGKLDATAEEIVEAAKAANAHDFICALPEGYETVVGTRGGRLSAGQRQRIGIARALIKAAPIVILDEPMTGLDSQTESEVLDALSRLIKGRTCILITHDSSTARLADRVFEVRHGSLREVSKARLASMKFGPPRLVGA